MENRKAKARRAVVIGMVVFAAGASCARPPTAAESAPATTASSTAEAVPPAPVADFSAVSQLVNDAVAAGELPGAVVTIGHGGTVVFQQAYGARKAAAEQGLDGSPAAAEPTTQDTIFDIASLTKVLATATAVMQLHEQGRVQFDDPVQQHLPQFNPADDPQRAQVTVRTLLTHTSGERGDVDLGDPWGLARPDKAEGIRRALTTPLESVPGRVFRYSDINYIVLGALVEKLTGEPEDVYVQRHVFAPLGMTDTRFLPVSKACGAHTVRGAAIAWAPAEPDAMDCPAGSWSTSLLSRIAPTALDEEGRAEPSRNPNLDRLLRGTVHDTTARRMGGVAGHAGVFATARDVGRYAQALLDRLAGRPSNFPLSQATLQTMTSPQQPGHSGSQLDAANAAVREALENTPNAVGPLLAPAYPAIKGQNLRGLGWDIDTALSQPRGTVFPIGSFGHSGFTGTSVWLDPGSDTYVVVLTNSIHVRGSRPINDLRGAIATTAARALGLYGTVPSGRALAPASPPRPK